jgi:hypothetical protein
MVVFGMTSLVLFESRAPSKLADDLILAGYRVFEALELSEVLYLCETEWIDVVVIGADAGASDDIEAQMRCVTMRLKSESTANDVIWELTQLFPPGIATVQ